MATFKVSTKNNGNSVKLKKTQNKCTTQTEAWNSAAQKPNFDPNFTYSYIHTDTHNFFKWQTSRWWCSKKPQRFLKWSLYRPSIFRYAKPTTLNQWKQEFTKSARWSIAVSLVINSYKLKWFGHIEHTESRLGQAMYSTMMYLSLSL